MTPSDEQLLAELKRDDQRRARRISLIVGLVLIGLGAVLAALGVTYEHPVHRLATRDVPRGAEYALIAGGALAALGGVGMLVKALRSARR